MGVGCFNSKMVINNENKTFTNITIQNNTIFFTPNTYEKILLIQKRIKGFLNKIKFHKKLKKLFEKLTKELENIKLLNADVITNSKSYKLYQQFFKTGLFKPYTEYISRNQKLSSKLKVMSKFTIDLPYFIVFSQRISYKGQLNLDKKYHGYGILYQYNKVSNKERIIEGIFYNGVLSEYGRIVISNGEMLRGDFRNNRLDGMGEYRRKDGSIFTGIFLKDILKEMGKKLLKMVLSLKGIILKERKNSENMNLKIKIDMKVILIMIYFMEKVYMNGVIKKNMKENGMKVK